MIDWKRLAYKTCEGQVAAALEWHLTTHDDAAMQSLLGWWVEWWYAHPDAETAELQVELATLEAWSASRVAEILDDFAMEAADVNLIEFCWGAAKEFCKP